MLFLFVYLVHCVDDVCLSDDICCLIISASTWLTEGKGLICQFTSTINGDEQVNYLGLCSEEHVL